MGDGGLEHVAVTSKRPTEPERSFEVRLQPQPSNVSEARRLVRGLLARGGRSDLLDSASLLISEIVTNALLHAGTDIDVSGRLDSDGLLLRVRDGSRHVPSRRHYAATAGTGRGLMMLDSLGDEWGVEEHSDGKTVWFKISRGQSDGSAPGVVAARSIGPHQAERRSVQVKLLNMPLLLHAAWQEHAEALLREHLLAHLDDDVDSIQVHADATDAIALLEEHVPEAQVPLGTDELMEDAAEPGVSAERVDVPVPVESVPHFATLDRALRAAIDLSFDGVMLTPPSQPEMQEFRRWLCREVQGQADGAEPEAWSVRPAGAASRPAPSGWDPTPVSEAAEPRVAADEAGLILAVSTSAVRLLGYDDRADLVGSRIVAIVPPRLQQAHVAGFTMYQLVGRRPLLDRPVVVPALRRDGSEVDVELIVHEESLASGRVVLHARLRPVGSQG